MIVDGLCPNNISEKMAEKEQILSDKTETASKVDLQRVTCKKNA